MQHRLGPILYHHCQMQGAHWVVPGRFRADWAEAFRKSALRSLSIRQALFRLDSILREASIPYAALKGAYLSFHVYLHPALRPMRDIDIIVAPENALAVFMLLEAHGFKRPAEYAGTAEYALENTKHLPPLRCTKSRISVEVHTRIVEHVTLVPKIGSIDDTVSLLSRVERHGGIAVLDTTDTLLHLVVHAVYGHRFNNGPMVLNDIARLVAKTKIDWARFWNMAEIGGWSRGCNLLFAMVRHYHDQCVLPEPHTGAEIPTTEQLDAASLLMLQEFDQRGIVAFRGELTGTRSLVGKFLLLLKRAFPARHVLAAFAGSPSVAPWVIVHYPRWLLVRVRQMLFERQKDDVALDIRRNVTLEDWLHPDR
jgi:hypothetical protein